MGYQGYSEYLCAKGHYNTCDCYESLSACQVEGCGAALVYSHSVDETNGREDSHPGTCPAPKKEIGFEDAWHVDHHGNRYATKVPIYVRSGSDVWVDIAEERRRIEAEVADARARERWGIASVRNQFNVLTEYETDPLTFQFTEVNDEGRWHLFKTEEEARTAMVSISAALEGHPLRAILDRDLMVFRTHLER